MRCTGRAALLLRLALAFNAGVPLLSAWSAFARSNELSRVRAGVCAPVPHGVAVSSRSFEKPVCLYIPNNVEVVRFRKLCVRDGGVVPSIELPGACKYEGEMGVVAEGVGGSDGGGEDSSKRPRGLGFIWIVSKSSSSEVES